MNRPTQKTYQFRIRVRRLIGKGGHLDKAYLHAWQCLELLLLWDTTLKITTCLPMLQLLLLLPLLHTGIEGMAIKIQQSLRQIK